MAKLDSYSIYARTFPVYITIAPIVLILFAILPKGLDWKLGVPASIAWFPLSYLCRQIGGYLGKKRENSLWNKWGGPPTTRFLRHGNSEFNTMLRRLIHHKLRGLGLYVPSQDEQDQNPREADDHYQSATKELIRLTRNTRCFHLVFKGLKEYGFWRNIFALKPFGLMLAILSFGVCVIMAFHDWSTGNQFVLAVVCGIINLGLIIVWFFFITEQAVSLAADRYARFLLEAALDLEIKDGNDSLSER